MKYTDVDKDRIIAGTKDKLYELISDFTNLRKSGISYIGKCPECGDEKGLTVTPSKPIFNCFKCGQITGNSPISYLMLAEKKSFPEALEYLATKFSIYTDEPKPTKKIVLKTEPEKQKSYCERMLIESGLCEKDVQASITVKDENKTVLTSRVFKAGTVNNFFEIVSGDDVIIEYYDLDGLPIRYAEKNGKGRLTGKMKEFFRIRYQYPSEHLDKNGKATKYKSPWGSGNFLFIPEKIRDMYRKGEHIDRLFLQEGEKKAEKACKHGIWSVGLSGINNLGSDGKLPEDLIRIIHKLKVKEVILLFDADFDEISSDIKINDSVDKRPRNFFYAARNFKEYMRTLMNRQLYVETYVGNISKNEKGDKGIDDLLSNTLKGKEADLLADINYLIYEKNLTGKFIKLNKVTTWTDNKLEEIWNLNNPQNFANKHKALLKHLPEFRIGKHKWRFNDTGEIESAQPIESDEQFWQEIIGTDKHGNVKITYKFRYENNLNFLRNRGFGRYRQLNGVSQFIHITPPTVRIVEHTEIRDYMKSFLRDLRYMEVLELLHTGGKQYVGPDNLSDMHFLQPTFETPKRDTQLFYFNSTCWEITEKEVKELDYTAVQYQIWSDQRQDFKAKKLEKPLIEVRRENGKFSYQISDSGEACHILTFLQNTSNFTWRKAKQNQPIEPEEAYEDIQHLVAKLASIGYMLMSCKDRSVSRAVVAMDGRQSEVGQSNGRSGKSIVGELFKQVLPTTYIDGKKKDIEGDNFLWDGVTEKTKAVFMDDVRTNFGLEFLFANITGDWQVNNKGGGRMTIPFQQSPKLYITTNHALNGSGSSFIDRQWLIAFSDYYNDQHKPIDDFGCLFFDEWEFEQWNLLWNLLADCVQIYLRFGVVQSPSDRIETRQLRQMMGENFLGWADEYFSGDDKINTRLPKKDIYDSFMLYAPDQRKFCNPSNFKSKIKSFCTWKGYIFNPSRFDPVTGLPMFFDKDGRPDSDDKSNGTEYFTIGVSNAKKEVAVTTTVPIQSSINWVSNAEKEVDEKGFAF